MTETTDVVLRLEGLQKYYGGGSSFFSRKKQKPVRAVERVDVEVHRGECLGIVGESGSGKSTLGRLVLRLIEPTAGSVFYEGQNVSTMGQGRLRRFRAKMQMIFQDPYSSLNPRMTIGKTLAEAIRFHRVVPREETEAHVQHVLRMVGLPAEFAQRYPRALSGGQRQRVAIARALAVNPSLVVADEAVSALDVSIQAEILNLLQDIREKEGLTTLFISHDLSVVEMMSDRVLVMYLGRVVEIASAEKIYRDPRQPYTRALLSASPSFQGEPMTLEGEIPSPTDPPSGCVFRTRCPFAVQECSERVPELREVTPGQFAACIRREVAGETIGETREQVRQDAPT
jgi:oligopeptide/dipeptide ABC transporter ATP-binding protein